MKISFHYTQDEKHEPPSFTIEPETDFERYYLQAHFLRRLPGQSPCAYVAKMVLDCETRGTGDVCFMCVDNGLQEPYQWKKDTV